MLIRSRRGFLTGVGTFGLSLAFGTTLAAASDTNTVFLTFDDGYIGTADKAQALAALGVLGTFFLTGQAIEWHPGEAQTALNLGHRIANHTYDHKDLTTLSGANVSTEIQRCEDAANRVLGVSTAPLLHAPYFAENAFVRGVAGQVGFTVVRTTWDTNDWAGSSAAYIAARVKPGIVTMHTQGRNTIAGLNAVVPDLLSQGYTFAVMG